MPKINEKTYIADGVYAWFDGYQIWVTLDQCPEARPHEIGSIALDDRVLQSLLDLRHHPSFRTAAEAEEIEEEDLQAAADMFDKICGKPV